MRRSITHHEFTTLQNALYVAVDSYNDSRYHPDASAWSRAHYQALAANVRNLLELLDGASITVVEK